MNVGVVMTRGGEVLKDEQHRVITLAFTFGLCLTTTPLDIASILIEVRREQLGMLAWVCVYEATKTYSEKDTFKYALQQGDNARPGCCVPEN